MRYPKRVRFGKIRYRKKSKELIGVGLCDFNTKTITIDLNSRVPPGKIALHELLHYNYPTMGEKKVLMYEGIIWRKMNQRQKFELYRWLFSRRVKWK